MLNEKGKMKSFNDAEMSYTPRNFKSKKRLFEFKKFDDHVEIKGQSHHHIRRKKKTVFAKNTPVPEFF